jgi:hypothetical protein
METLAGEEGARLNNAMQTYKEDVEKNLVGDDPGTNRPDGGRPDDAAVRALCVKIEHWRRHLRELGSQTADGRKVPSS